ncbi:MAG: GAF domain-containing protein [Desulfotignum sp.]|nr:GAF domain-containing protein [Desulfotignum sp.]
MSFPTQTYDTWAGIWGEAMTEKKSRYINGRLHLPGGHIDIDNALDAPVVYQDRLVGNLLIGQKDTGYTDDDQDLMEMVADQIAPVLKTAWSGTGRKKSGGRRKPGFSRSRNWRRSAAWPGGLPMISTTFFPPLSGMPSWPWTGCPKTIRPRLTLSRSTKGESGPKTW